MPNAPGVKRVRCTVVRSAIAFGVLALAPRPSLAAVDTLLVSLRAEELARAKASLQRGDSALRPALERLLKDATQALAAGPFSVMQKKRVPPSGDRHDYMSLAPYWWPDSGSRTGLPYVR